MGKKNRTVTLDDETWKLLNRIQKENNLRSNSAAIEYVVSKEMNNGNEQLADKIIEKFDEKYNNLFTRIRLGSNGAEKNSQVLIEILNSMIVNLSLSDYFSTDTLESNIVIESKENVKERIARLKQIKDNKGTKSTK